MHVCGAGDELELWLGEVKFYSEIGSAIADVAKELEKHLSFDYLKAEFIPIRRKLEASAEDEALILAMTDKNVTLDKIVKRICAVSYTHLYPQARQPLLEVWKFQPSLPPR